MSDRSTQRTDLLTKLRSLDARDRRDLSPVPSTGRARTIDGIDKRAVARLKGICPLCSAALVSKPYTRRFPPAFPDRPMTPVSALRSLSCAGSCDPHDVMEAAAAAYRNRPTATSKPAAVDRPTRELKPRTPDIVYRDPKLHRA